MSLFARLGLADLADTVAAIGPRTPTWAVFMTGSRAMYAIQLKNNKRRLPGLPPDALLALLETTLERVPAGTLGIILEVESAHGCEHPFFGGDEMSEAWQRWRIFCSMCRAVSSRFQYNFSREQ